MIIQLSFHSNKQCFSIWQFSYNVTSLLYIEIIIYRYLLEVEKLTSAMKGDVENYLFILLK
jgi:hypothetical protein